MNKTEFLEYLKKINITPNKKQLEQLDHFYHLLIEWNKKINLTRITEEKEVYLKHFYDSLTLNKVVDLKKIKTLCDVGTGAGFPGIVLKIIFPDIKITLIDSLKITLIDSLKKRIDYLNVIIKELELENIEAIHIRGEDFKGSFDLVTSRAVANIEKLVKYTMHLVSQNGFFVAMKGNVDDELIKPVINKIKSKYIIYKLEKFNLPIENSKRALLVLKNK